jgi:undecaprenyl-diphosphatase
VIIGIAIVFFLKQSRDRQRHIIIFGAAAFLVIFAIAEIISLFYYDTRPFMVNHFPPLIPHTPDNGFPSDHTLLGASIASIVYPFNRKISVLLWALTGFVGWSRVYAGIHHPIDVWGSVVIAILAASLTYQLIKRSKYYLIKENKDHE